MLKKKIIKMTKEKISKRREKTEKTAKKAIKGSLYCKIINKNRMKN